MSEHREIKSLILKANKAHREMDAACSKIYNLLLNKISIEDDAAHVFIQDGDGIVLSWESSRGASNTPVEYIFKMYKEKGTKLDNSDLLSISI